ncbi:MAG: hypothetical protein RLZZ401_1454 [Pseudomonadota bacterium]|jgi:sterol desaturase/sphingolipid hydroxylase (fatty acid hydroxylase superfamily)
MASAARSAATLALLALLMELAMRVFSQLQAVVPQAQPGMVGLGAQCLLWFCAVVVFALPLMLIERLWPGSPEPRRPRQWSRAALFWAAYVPFAVITANLAPLIATWLGIHPLLDLRLDGWALQGPGRTLANLGLLFLALLLLDFFYYWLHRLQHRLPWLWRFHRAHHANRYVNALSCYHHPLEEILRIPLFILPMAWVFRIEAPPLILFSGLAAGWAYFCHTDSPIHIGPLRCILTDNRYHRIHHSTDARHFDSNFAFYFSLTDRLFGTQHMPAEDGSVPEVGLSDVASPTSLWALWCMPFRR